MSDLHEHELPDPGPLDVGELRSCPGCGLTFEVIQAGDEKMWVRYIPGWLKRRMEQSKENAS